jgi:Protein of unknown function (DUF1565)
MSGVGRTLFLVVAVTAIALVIGSTACTRRGGNGIPPAPTPTPITGYYVDPVKGSDSNNGSQTAPFKTITHALAMVKKSTASPLTVALDPGVYTRNSGETFPLVIPTGVSLTGTNYGHSVAKGSYINGSGEDTTLEKATGRPSHTLFTTIVVPSGIALTLDKIYVGTTAPSLLGTYGSVDVLGSLSANADTFGQGGRFQANGGVVVASGTLSCTACAVLGRDFAIKAFSISGSSSSGSSGGGPSITLQGPGHSVIGGSDGIRTDGTATIMASTQVFQSRNNAYTDSLAVPTTAPDSATSPSPSPTSGSSSGASSSGGIDFGGGPQNGPGSNTFVGSATEINVTLSGEHVYARNNTWNVIRCVCPQRTNLSGQYQKSIDFGPGANGQNIKIAGNAAGSIVTVGPAKPPTPTPSPYSSGSPSASPSPTSSPS